MKSTNLLNFKIDENCIWSNNDQVFFYRILPPNLSIMTDKEKKQEISKMQGLLDTLDVPMQIFGIDKTENLDENKAFYQSLDDKYSTYRDAIVEKIASVEVSQSSSIQRAYYLIIKPSSPEKRKQLESGLENQLIKYYAVEKKELVTIIRNFLLREFDSFDIFTFEQDLDNECEKSNKKGADTKSYISDKLTKRLMPQSMNFYFTSLRAKWVY